jgi:IS605 OrfB family transposase
MSRQVAHGVVWFPEPVKTRVLDLMKAQSSAARSAYQAIHKHGLKGNAVKQRVKCNFMDLLNQRYISDAVSRVAAIEDEGVLFGGKQAWKDMQSGKLSKEEWQERRNGQLYSRGDRTKSGNPNIRIVGDKLLVNDPSGRGKWLEGRLFIPDKWKPALDCYDVRLLYRDGKFEVKVSWTDPDAPKMPTVAGAIGVDCNPDGVAVVEVTEDGNLKHHQYEREQRIQFAGRGKRDYDIKQLAVRVVDAAKEARKPLVVEKLNFSPGSRKKGYRKFRRCKSNFSYRQMLTAIKSRATREGVPLVEVQPAFTSVLGNLKYAVPYSLNRHTAAAMVIGRRGMGLLERQDFTVTQDESDSEKLHLEGKGFKHTLTPKAYSFLQACGLKEKPAGLTAPALAPGSIPGIGASVGEIPTGETCSKTGRAGRVNNSQAEERRPSGVERIFQVP